MSLRSRQKKARQQVIIEAAKQQFQQNGYSKTNMDDIADLAEVGVATIYTYFESKDGVFAALIRSYMEKAKQKVDEIKDNLGSDPVEALSKVFRIYMEIHEDMSPELIREFIIRGKVKGISQNTIKWVHAWQMEQVTYLLKKGQQDGTVSETLDVATAAGILIDIYEYHSSRLTTNEENIKNKLDLFVVIKVLFENWRTV